jgi:peptidoglycan/LPS O-acetylase OafA/YrhL
MKHVREFDGLRGLLALWVFFAHAIELGPFSSVAGHLRPQFAVDIFIVLSGFVIFHLLSTGEDYGTFITRRFFRLFPVFAACFLFALLLRGALNSHDEIAFGLVGSPRLTPYLATHAAMLHGAVPEQWLPLSAEAILPPAWSISLEWQFYLLAPLLFMLLVKPRWSLAFLLLGLVVMRALWERHSLGLLVPGGPRDLTFNMNAFLPLKLEFFAVGVLSWALWRAFVDGKLRVGPWFSWLAFLGAPLVWCATDSLSLALWTFLFVALMAAQSGAPGILPGSMSILRTRPVRALGKISYPLYLVHVPAIALMRHLLQQIAPNLGPVPFAVALIGLSMVASVVLAALLHVTIERPMMDFGKRATARWHTEHATVSAPVLTAQNSSQQSPG